MTPRASILAILAAFAAAVPAAASAATPPALEPFDSCSNLIAYGNRHSHRFAFPRPRMRALSAPGAALEDQAAANGAPATGGGGTGGGFSTTNVQEAGVDEPDVVKSDGNRILAIADGTLNAVDITGATPRLAGSLRLSRGGWGHELLIHGNRALITWGDSGSGDGHWRQTTVLAEVDISDSGALRVLRTLEVDGDLVAARLTGSTARLVLRSSPSALARPVYRIRGGRYRLRKAPRAKQWLPAAELRDRTTGRVARHAAVRCGDVRHAPVFSGLATVTVLTIDMARGLEPVDSDAVITDADTVYASPTGLYVATQRWMREGSTRLPSVPTTLIHKFDISDPVRTDYRGSGAVPGYLLSQWALSEHEGVLRVASTDRPEWWDPSGDARRTSQSFVTTLGEQPGTGSLVKLGSVGGLGKGERIYAVRFIGTLGYVVTFRETDPLYTIDVSNPASPKVVGELKIRGYSAYLHPAGDGLLIGIGQDATDRGRTLGTQISLFDVSDPRNPLRLHQRTIASGSSSEVEYDHHAFLWWPATGLAVLPISVWTEQEGRPYMGAVGLGVDRTAGIREVGRVEHPSRGDWPDAVSRSLVAGDRLYTLSAGGLMQSTLDTLSRTAWVKF